MFSAKNKKFVDSEITYMVMVHCDITQKYRSIVDVPQEEIVTHEFPCTKSTNEYVNVLIDMNKTEMEGRWHYLIAPSSIKFSEKYTNKTNQ